MADVLIEAMNMKKHFPIRGGLLNRKQGSIKAVDGVSFYIKRGETLGLVGESGCGKTTVGRCILNLTKPTGGHVYYKMPADIREKLAALDDMLSSLQEKKAGLETEKEAIKGEKSKIGKLDEKIAELKAKIKEAKEDLDLIEEEYALDKKHPEEMRHLRKEMQIVFQDPFSSLDPRFLIKDVVGEPLLVHGIASGDELLERVTSLLETVGLNPEHLYRYPHEFSGGQRQRIGVARALALNPDLVVLDEPTSALDISVQAQILNMLNDLQEQFGLTYLFISHDLSTIRYMCDRICVMYLGKIVESAPKNELFDHPLHPYTQALLSVIPVPDPDLKRERVGLAGEIPSPANPPSGCRFHTRCKFRQAICDEQEPPLRDIGGEHFVACHFR